MSLDEKNHLDVIEKRLGRLEKLINVVLERQEKQALKLERHVGYLSDKIGYKVDGVREYLQGSFLDEVCDEMKGKTESMTELRYVYMLPCGDNPNHAFVLPRHSPLGIFDGLQSQPTDIWPLKFVCLQDEKVSDLEAPNCRLAEVHSPAPYLREACLWEIEYECGQPDCGLRQTIYTRDYKDKNPKGVTVSVAGCAAKPTCANGHSAVLKAASMSATKLE